MAFKYHKRIRLGKGIGLNISKSGISTSFRSKIGSISSRGYSIRTGIPGLSYRKSFKKGKGCLLFCMLLISIPFTTFSILFYLL
ncbi:DUF4236 domain-containing protein [Aquimarina sp. RZ0]|uniref:DUF4236 domain-containing protein n=1 Tax=Aquimarina sp. RZ0 TaxID=2607730 RepID=UPI0011F243CF|nr:DUF4236 domain-containing protein [Aquimarina sp. RZ0]KAA1245874.1 DUF4236 domain-containing protein [Aquimarina sp. RZ0]